MLLKYFRTVKWVLFVQGVWWQTQWQNTKLCFWAKPEHERAALGLVARCGGSFHSSHSPHPDSDGGGTTSCCRLSKQKSAAPAFLLFWKISFLENLNIPVSRAQPVSAWGSEAALGESRWLGWWSQAGAADAADAGGLVVFFVYAGAFLLRQSAGANTRQTGLGSGR